MGKRWTEADVDRLLKGLREEPTGDVFWKDRVWKNIESGLPAEARARLATPWWRRPSVLRLGLAAACLALAMGWWHVQVTSTDMELADFVSNISDSDATFDVADVRCSAQMGPVDAEDASLEMEKVYEVL